MCDIKSVELENHILSYLWIDNSEANRLLRTFGINRNYITILYRRGVSILSTRFILNIYSWEKRLYEDGQGEATLSVWHNDACNFPSPSLPLHTPYLIPQDDAGSFLPYTVQATVLFALHSKISYFETVNKTSLIGSTMANYKGFSTFYKRIWLMRKSLLSHIN